VLTTTESLRNRIIKDNHDVTAVGIILDWTNSDNKFIALELKLEDDKILFLTSVNYRKLPGREPFYLRRVGNYAFAKIEHFADKRTNKSETKIRTNLNYSLSNLSADIGAQVNSMRDLIKYYDNIYSFVESLPTADENNYHEIIEESKLIGGIIEENEYYFVTTYFVKTVWNDEYYGYRWKNGKEDSRRPDYYNNEFIGEVYFSGF
jgi:hypothetical protein